MSKSTRLVLFFLGATVFNILLMVALILVFVAVASFVTNPTIRMVIIFVGFVASIVLTFLIYGKVMKWVTVKFQLEKNIPQLFKKKR